jgi:hypothetical protein
VVYASIADYTADAEWLVTRPPDAAFDYVEGFAFVNSDDPVNGWPSVPIPGGARFDPSLLPAGAGPVLYCLEVALYQYAHRPDDDDEEDQVGSSNCQSLPPAENWRIPVLDPLARSGVYFSAGRACLTRLVVYLPLDSVTGGLRPAKPNHPRLDRPPGAGVAPLAARGDRRQ